MYIARLWTVGIIVVSFLPSEAKEAIGTETRSPLPAAQHRAVVMHTSGHLIAFGIASLLFTVASTRKIHRHYYLFMTAVLGLIIEYLEHAIYGSPFEWWDVRNDWVAAVIGYLLGLLWVAAFQLADNATS